MKYTCCFCGKTFYGYGNNPYPLNKSPKAQCCNDCNIKVIEARLQHLVEQKELHKLHKYGLLEDGHIIELYNSDGSLKSRVKFADNKTIYSCYSIVASDHYNVVDYEIIYDSDDIEELEQIRKTRRIKENEGEN